MDNERIQRLHKFMHDFKMFLRDNYYDIENKDIQWYLRGLVQFNVNESSELIMENYEKLYKDALERAKNIYGASESKDIISTLTTIFPELKESEGERIRKELISFIENWKVYNPNSPFADYPIYTSDKKKIDDILSWIEKQGEQETTDNKELKKIDARENLTLDGDLMQADCMIIEPNSAWSEKDDKMLDDAIGAVGAADYYYTYNDKEEIEHWLKSLKERMKGE